MFTRRKMISAAAIAGGAAILSKIQSPSIARASDDSSSTLQTNLPTTSPANSSGDYVPVHTPNGDTLAFKLIDGVKVMHLTAHAIKHQFAPGLTAQCWGYNNRTPGPTIEAVAGDRLRIYVTNRLPEPTTIHWHGLRIPNGMDGVNGLTQPAIPIGSTFRYEFTVPDPGTFMYHPHYDEMTQQSMGLMGMFIVHPRRRPQDAPTRDYVIMLSEWRIDPGTSRPVTTEMTDFNVLTMNSKCYPATEPLVAGLGEKIRIRFGNLSAMDHHPIHLHGMQMILTETDGGIIQQSARYAANTVLVPVGTTRTVEFIADNPGDWPMHCHMTHHAMNQMGHNVPNLIGVNSDAMDKAIESVLPGYMTMGSTGMGEMNDMSMPTPKNSIPMLGGKAQFGILDMGGMFTLLKVRDQINGFEDPGDYHFPSGTVAAEATSSELNRDGIDVNS